MHEQKRYYDISTIQHGSANYFKLDETTKGKSRQPRPNDLSQDTGIISNALDDKSTRRRSSWTEVVRTAARRILPGDAGQSWQKDQIRHTQMSASRRAPRSAAAPYEQVKRESYELREIRHHAQSLENTVHKLTKELKIAREEISILRKAVTENEAIITQAHATAISTLAGNVSRGITDDMIREELNKFLQTEFFSWCADLCTEKILDEQAALHKLLQDGIINKRESYLKSPEYLKFTLNTPDGNGPFVLLQAVLIHRLCHFYLCDAYFLAKELHSKSNNRSNLCQLERIFSQSMYFVCPHR